MIDITKYKLNLSKIKNNFKICLVSDLHNEEYYDIIKIIQIEKPDFIAVTGDISVRYTRAYENGIEFLKEAARICPVYFSLGNHEADFFSDKHISEVKNSGAILLDNEFCKFGDIYIGGLTSSRAFSDFNFLDSFSRQKAPKLLLCHNPEYYVKFLKNYDFDLILSGHAHGGQVRLPFIGGLFSSGQGIFPKLTDGVKFKKLVISRGLGNPNKLPRWFNNRELVFIEAYTIYR